jgi:hypothetical protein
MALEFEWDENKANANFQKHGISFDKAKTVFDDPNSITISDSKHSSSEDRYIDIGLSSQGQLLVVVYTERGSKIRIISSRKPTAKEAEVYERN